MDKINKFLTSNSKYTRLSGPLRAAQVCDNMRLLANDRFGVLSFKDGLLTLSVTSSSAAANLQSQTHELIEEINKKIDQKLVEKIRIKIV